MFLLYQRGTLFFPHWSVGTLITLQFGQFVIPNHAITKSQPCIDSAPWKAAPRSRGSRAFADVVTHADAGQLEHRWPTLICYWKRWLLERIGNVFIRTKKAFSLLFPFLINASNKAAGERNETHEGILVFLYWLCFLKQEKKEKKNKLFHQQDFPSFLQILE